MDKQLLIAECGRLHRALSQSTALNYDLRTKINEKDIRIRQLVQKVNTRERAKQKLQKIVDDFIDEQKISGETAEILKVR